MLVHGLVILFAFVLEVGMLTFLRGTFGISYSPVVLFLASLFIGLYPIIIFSRNRIIKWRLDSDRRPHRLKIVLIASVIVAGITINALYLSRVFGEYEINAAKSDIIPCIQIMVNRITHNEFPYETISDWGYDLSPNYLPLTWLPFILAKVLNSDFRWIPFAVWCLSIVLWAFFFLRKNPPLIYGALFSMLPFMVLLVFIRYEPDVFGYSIELLMAGYYLILSLSIVSRSNILRAIGIILCLLSRYSLLLWLPLYVMIVFFREAKRNIIIILSLTFLAVLLIYYVPFLSHDRTILGKGYSYYTTCALGEWNLSQDQGDKPYHLFRGVGFACYFYDFLHGSLKDRLRILQSVHLIISALSVLLLGFIYVKLKHRIEYKLYLLFSLKVYLTLFYSFIQVPYIYLFLVPVFVSLSILWVIFMFPIDVRKLQETSG